MPTHYLDWSPVDPKTLTEPGAPLPAALEGHLPIDDSDVQVFLARYDDGSQQWRLIFDGQVPDWGDHAIRLAAPKDDGWQIATFVAQEDGGWSALLTPGPISVHQE